MKRTNDKARATAATYRAKPFRPHALNWIDFLVIAAIALTFVAIAGSTMKHARATVSIDPPTFATEVGQIADDPGLIKARIRLAAGQPWG